MSTQITKRALLTTHGLSAGLGAGALAVLAQRASADTPFTGFAFPATGAPTLRTMPDRLAEIVNVKDFGATGDGVTDDTAAIQRALDAAFGPTMTPHGVANAHLSRSVYFPNGKYIVNSGCVNRTVTNITQAGDGRLTYTLSPNTTGLANNDTVWIDGINYSVTGGVPNGTRRITLGNSVGANRSTQITTENPNIPFGGYGGGGRVTKPCLMMTYPVGAGLFGSGMYSSQIICNTSGGIVLGTNGMRFFTFRELAFRSSGTNSKGVQIDLDGQYGIYQGVFAVAFYDCNFGGAARGLEVAPTSGSQGDTIGVYNCVFTSNIQGLSVGLYNMNALNINVFGGNFITNGNGIVNAMGSMGTISGVCFEESSSGDIWSEGGSEQQLNIVGCSSESNNFLQYAGHSLVSIVGCNQRGGGGAGVFAVCTYMAEIISCYSRSGVIKLQSGGTVSNSQFERTDVIFADASYLKPIYIKNCSIGGSIWGTGAPPTGFTEGTHVDGFFINSSGGTQYFVGRKTAQTGTSSGLVITNMLVSQLPPPSQPYTKGLYVTVFDSTPSTVGSTITPGSSGGGSNVVLVFNNGTNWKIAAV
jgi:Pectate lyase superfamily protein